MVVLHHWECTTCHCLYTLKRLTLCCTNLSSKKEHPTFWTARLKTNILCPIESILRLTRSLPSCRHPAGPRGILQNSWTTAVSWVAKWVIATGNKAVASAHLGWGGKRHSPHTLSSWVLEHSTVWWTPVLSALLSQLNMCLRSVVSDSLWPHGLWPARLLCLWNFPGKNSGVGCHFIPQGILLTQRSNPCLLRLLHCRKSLYHCAICEPSIEHAPLHKCVLMTGNTARPNHRHLHAVFRRESEMCVVICHPVLPRDLEQTLRPQSTRIQNAISDCVVVFCHASLISSCGDQGYGAVLVSTLPRLFTIYKDQKHTDIGRKY